jgi:large subunit ribosomal protein L35
MPKMKSKGAVKGRFRVTKSGKIKCSRPGRGHMHAKNSAKLSRELRKPIIITGTWAVLMRKMLGGRV